MTEAESLAFKTGYLLACCNLTNLHDQPTIAADVLGEAGITTADLRAMDLSDYDKAALREIRKSVGKKNDPITKTR